MLLSLWTGPRRPWRRPRSHSSRPRRVSYPPWSLGFRRLSVVPLVFFSWMCVEPWHFAVAAQGSPKPLSPSPRSHTAPERFEDSLRAVKQGVESLAQQVAQGQEIRGTIERLRGHQKTLAEADEEIRREFAQTEARIKEAKLPGIILERHQKAVATYEENYLTLRENLQAIEQAEQERTAAEKRRDQAEAKAKTDQLSQRIKEAKTHLQATVKERPHVPLDPNNLPHRTPKVKERKPRMSKAEFAALSLSLPLPQFGGGWGWGDISPVMASGSEAISGGASVLPIALQDLPTPADLAETVEVQFTPEITALATQLEKSPVKIYNHVRNTIDFVPTYGSIQGAPMCLMTTQCNDMDTASLLIALLRASGIAARYVIGTVEIPIDKGMNWMGGFADPRAAVQFIASGGTLITGLISGGTIGVARWRTAGKNESKFGGYLPGMIFPNTTGRRAPVTRGMFPGRPWKVS